MEQSFADLQSFVAELGPVVSVLTVTVLGGIPFIESYFGTVLGALAGVPLPLALGAALVGNTAAVLVAGSLGGAIARRREGSATAVSSRRARIVARTDKYGVPIASLLAPTVFAISLTTFIMTSVGYGRRRVIVWQIAAAVVWGAGMAAAFAGMSSLAR